MGKVLHRLRTAYRLELRLVAGHWSYWALFLLYGAAVFWTFHSSDLGSAHAALEGDTRYLCTALLSLLGVFVSGASASRSQRTRFAAVEETLPAGAEVTVGRWLAVLTALMAPTLISLGRAWLNGPPSSFWAGAPTFVAEVLISLAMLTSGAWFLIDRLGPKRWVFPLLGLWWLLFFYGPVLVNQQGNGLRGGGLINPFIWGFSTYEELWGRLMHGRLPLLADLWFLGLAVVLMGSVLWRIQRARTHRLPVMAAASTLVALVLAVTAGTLYVRDWGPVPTSNSYPPTMGPVTGPVVASAYDVAADLTNPGRPSFTARLNLENRSGEAVSTAVLTLNGSLTVSALSVPYQRQGDTIQLALPSPLAPGDSLPITMAYAGTIWTTWKPRADSPPEAAYFTHPDGVRLFSGAGWYPLAGRPPIGLQPSGRLMFDVQHLPASFHLTVKAPPSFEVISNLSVTAPGEFRNDKVAWALLIASPKLAVEEAGIVTLAAARDDLPVVRPYAAEVELAVRYLSRFFPDQKVDGVTLLVGDSSLGLPERAAPAGNHLLVSTTRQFLSSIPAYPSNDYGAYGRPLIDQFWQLEGVKPEGPNLQATALFLWTHYREGGDPERVKTRIAPFGNPLADGLAQVYLEQGEAAIMRALKQLRQTDPNAVADLTPPEALRWVKEAAGGAH